MEDEMILPPQPNNLVAHRNQDAPSPPPPPMHDNQQPSRLLGPGSLERMERMIVADGWGVTQGSASKGWDFPTGDISTPKWCLLKSNKDKEFTFCECCIAEIYIVFNSLPCQPVSNLCPIRGPPSPSIPRFGFARPVGRVAGWQINLSFQRVSDNQSVW